jgi:uncharacterized surface protein with fasciclin (FAS1) repeats
MKRTSSLLLITILGALFFSQSATASWWKKANQCRTEPLIDVRGDAAIDGILGDGPDGKVTIAEVAVANPLGNLDGLVNAVLAADPLVLDAIADPNARLTVFAPDNEAFAAIPGEVLNGIVDAGGLTDVLLYHVVAGHFDPRRVYYVRPVNSLLSQDLFVKKGRRSPSINNSGISCAGVRTDNGLVWIIDSVLLPQF